MQELIIGLTIAAVSGLSFLAYKHPTGFKKIQTALNYLGVFIMLALSIWNFAISKAYIKLMPFINHFQKSEAQDAFEKIEIPMSTVLVIYIAISLYLVFLSALPSLTKEKSDKSD